MILFIKVFIFLFSLFISSLSSYAQGIYVQEHNPTYLTVASNSRISDDPQNEVKIQLSFKKPFLDGLVNLGYTQVSFWNIKDDSSPFRETNYSPEGWIEIKANQILLFDQIQFKTGYRHQSNGEPRITSRSWERWVTSIKIIKGLYNAEYEYWHPFWEEQEDLSEFQGFWEFTHAIKYQNFALRNKVRIKSNKLQVLWDAGDFSLFAERWNGVGESMAFYKEPEYITRVGIKID